MTMNLVVDANVLFSALIKEGVTSNLLTKSNLILYSTEFIFQEFKKHKAEILNKSKRDKEDFERFLSIVEKRLLLISTEDLVNFLEQAQKISPDENDVIYFALALKLGCPIWSNDKKLKEQGEIQVYATHDLTN